MADICIVYASSNNQIVEKLYAILSREFDVWWDQHIHSGAYRTEIEAQLSQASCVIPVWCRVSRADRDVIDEVTFADRRSVKLLPVKTENVAGPLGFDSLQTIDLVGWDGDEKHPGIIDLQVRLRQLDKIIPRLLDRPSEIEVGSSKLINPTFFRSVSSHETQLRPDAAVQALKLFGAKAILVSAFDVVRSLQPENAENFIRNLTEIREAGAFVMLDSGNYEAFRTHDTSWTPENLAEACAICPHDAAFSFDELSGQSDVSSVVQSVLDAVERDTAATGSMILPIVHAPKNSLGEIVVEAIPEAICEVSRRIQPPIIAIPERELGDGLLKRARTVYEIRRKLDGLGFYQPLHLLGTGNPLSIAVLAAAGADFFDGLEWCRTVADYEDGRLYHFQQFDLFTYQSRFAESEVVRSAVKDDAISYSGKVVFHNLEFLEAWMSELTKQLHAGRVDRFLSARLPKGGIRALEEVIPEVFQ